ncbi:Isochorismatase hydrolase [Paramyrothecium foliicola]|nr:Isochorismatase hydrolase [Paramyrothecium foliicola]
MSESARTNSFRYERLDRKKAALVIIDHQVGLFQLVHDFEPTYFRQQMYNHARIAKAFELPVILTTSAQIGPNGPIPKDIVDLFPDAPIIHRHGEVNAMDNKEFRDALASLGRSQLIVGGIATDACTTFAALSMREAGYSVFANSEASGTTSVNIREDSNRRMRDAGVQILSAFAIFGELMRDWRTPPTGEPVWPLVDALIPNGGMLARAHGFAVEQGEIQDALSHLDLGVNSSYHWEQILGIRRCLFKMRDRHASRASFACVRCKKNKRRPTNDSKVLHRRIEALEEKLRSLSHGEQISENAEQQVQDPAKINQLFTIESQSRDLGNFNSLSRPPTTTPPQSHHSSYWQPPLQDTHQKDTISSTLLGSIESHNKKSLDATISRKDEARTPLGDINLSRAGSSSPTFGSLALFPYSGEDSKNSEHGKSADRGARSKQHVDRASPMGISSDVHPDPEPVVVHLLDLFWKWQACHVAAVDRDIFNTQRKIWNESGGDGNRNLYTPCLLYAILALASLVNLDVGVKRISARDDEPAGESLFSAYCNQPTCFMSWDFTIPIPDSETSLATSSKQSLVTLTSRLYVVFSRIIVGLYAQRRQRTTDQLRLLASQLHKDLWQWYQDLPHHFALADCEQYNFQGSDVFFLHMQFYFILIVLHRPFLQFSRVVHELTSHGDLTTTSTGTCALAASNIAKLLLNYQRTNNMRQVPAPTVNFVYIAGTIHLVNFRLTKLPVYWHHLKSCMAAMQDMSLSYPIGRKASSVLQELMERWQPSSEHVLSVIPEPSLASIDNRTANIRKTQDWLVLEDVPLVDLPSLPDVDSASLHDPRFIDPSDLMYQPSEGISQHDVRGVAAGTFAFDGEFNFTDRDVFDTFYGGTFAVD